MLRGAWQMHRCHILGRPKARMASLQGEHVRVSRVDMACYVASVMNRCRSAHPWPSRRRRVITWVKGNSPRIPAWMRVLRVSLTFLSTHPC